VARVAVVADTTASIPDDLMERYGISLVPLVFHLDGKTYRDIIDVKTSDELFQLVSQSASFPTTSAPPPGEFVRLYRSLGEKTDAIFTVTMSSALSMTYGSAVQAREEVAADLPNLKISVFDSRTTVGAMGFIAVAAARAATSGQGLEEIVRIADETRNLVKYLFMMDTLSYLARSGRISKAAAMAGNMLSMKPITEISTITGRPSVAARPRTKSKALQSLLGMMTERVGEARRLHVMIDHTSLAAEAEALRETIEKRFRCAEILLCRYHPISSLIVGPGGVGISFYPEAE
jgi:DegV family protein with EDD domain